MTALIENSFWYMSRFRAKKISKNDVDIYFMSWMELYSNLLITKIEFLSIQCLFDEQCLFTKRTCRRNIMSTKKESSKKWCRRNDCCKNKSHPIFYGWDDHLIYFFNKASNLNGSHAPCTHPLRTSLLSAMYVILHEFYFIWILQFLCSSIPAFGVLFLIVFQNLWPLLKCLLGRHPHKFLVVIAAVLASCDIRFTRVKIKSQCHLLAAFATKLEAVVSDFKSFENKHANYLVPQTKHCFRITHI